MDESGVEPETFRMLSERATNYATRPFSGSCKPTVFIRLTTIGGLSFILAELQI